MPVLLSVVELVDLDTFLIVFFFTHLDDVNTLQSLISLYTLFLPLISCTQFIQTKNSILGLQDSIALTVPSVNIQDFARYSTGRL